MELRAKNYRPIRMLCLFMAEGVYLVSNILCLANKRFDRTDTLDVSSRISAVHARRPPAVK